MGKSLLILVIVCVITGMTAACGATSESAEQQVTVSVSSSTPKTKSTGRPTSLPPDSPTLTVCEALTHPIGERVQVRGEFDGFTYETGSKRFAINSSGACTSNGAAMVWVKLWNSSEKKFVEDLMPSSGLDPGDGVVVEGEIVEDGEFMTPPFDDDEAARHLELKNAIVVFRLK